MELRPVTPYIFEQSTPFVIRDSYGSLVVPENLGYVADTSDHTSGPNTRKDLLSGAESLLTVRDSVASFFYHPFLGSAKLVGLVRELKSDGLHLHLTLPAVTMADIYDLLRESGGLSTVLLALSGLLFILYVLAIVAMVAWQKVRGR